MFCSHNQQTPLNFTSRTLAPMKEMVYHITELVYKLSLDTIVRMTNFSINALPFPFFSYKENCWSMNRKLSSLSAMRIQYIARASVMVKT